MTDLTHLNADGTARMVDVGDKTPTRREATATGRITMSPEALAAIREGTAKKGDVLAVARVAGIMAAKRTADLIPLCHPLPLTRVTLDLTLGQDGITATATCATDGKTGVEMEALTAATVALLTVYDMAKAIDRAMTIESVRVVAKSGGKSGDWGLSPDLEQHDGNSSDYNDNLFDRLMGEGVRGPQDLTKIVAEGGGGPHYVYILRYPDGVLHSGGVGTPFYVGIGQGTRLFTHEDQARNQAATGDKIEAIRAIWDSGKDIVRTIDSVHATEPWQREEVLINAIGRMADGTGPLTNAQVYAPSVVVDGIEIRKYAELPEVQTDPDAIPTSFKLRHVRLATGPRRPSSSHSVFGKIYAVAADHPGATGEELIALLQGVDFQGNKSAYTQSGRVSAAWLAGYIEGAYFRKDRQHLQRYE